MQKITIKVQKSTLKEGNLELSVIHNNGYEQIKQVAIIDNCKVADIKDYLPDNLQKLVNAEITDNGDIILNNVAAGIDLDVVTDGAFGNSCNLDLNGISIVAKEVKLQEKINIANKIVVSSDKFENHADLTADSCKLMCTNKVHNFNKLIANKYIEIQGTADFINEGVWVTSGMLSHTGHSILNSGIINVGDAKLALSKLQTENEPKTLFTNDNLFLVNNKLSMTASKMSVNTGKFIVLGEARFNLSSLYNKGDIAVAGKCYLNAKTHITNKKQGKIVTTDRLRLSFRSKVGKLINLGSMAADVVAVRDCQDFTNDVGAKLICRDLQLPVNGLFFNAGLIYGKEKCTLHIKNRHDLKPINTSDGLIISEQKVSLGVINNFSNYGEITGHKGVKGICFGSLFNLQQGSISSEDLLSLKATMQLVNDAEIIAKENEIVTQDLSNQVNGSIIGGDILRINGELLTNAGKLLSQEKVKLDIETLIENLRDGIISSANQLTINCGLKIKNAGLLEADQSMDLHSESGLITNTQNGDIVSPKIRIDVNGLTNFGNISGVNVDTKSTWLINGGEISAKELTIKVQSIFRNLQQGKIQVENLAQIISESNFDNLGKLFSNNKLEIIGKEVYSYKDAELNAEHFVYLEAINLFAKGEIQSACDLLLLVKENFEYEDAALQANGELLLRIKDGNQVKYNINTPGDLQFEFLTKEGMLYNNVSLQAGGDLIIDEPGYVIIHGNYSQRALMLAKKSLILDSKQLELQQGSLQGKHLDLTSKERLTVAEKAKLTGVDGSIRVTEDGFEQYGELEFTGNLFINANNQLILAGASKIGGVLEAIANGNVNITDSIEAQDIFIASLLDSVEIRSHKERIGNSENFTDILKRARVCAKNILQIFAQKDVVFESIETESGIGGTHIKSMANILDIPIDLVRQSVKHFHAKKCYGTIKDIWIQQVPSSHKTAGNFTYDAGANGVYFAPKIQAENADICSGNDTKFMLVESRHSCEANLQGKKSGMFGSKTKSYSSCQGNAATIGTNFAIRQQLKVDSKWDLELHQPLSTALHNKFLADGEVSILHGRKSSYFSESSSSRDAMWSKSSSTSGSSEQYIAPQFSGSISIKAKSARIEVVSGRILDFLDQIKEQPDDLTYVTLYEQYQYHHESQEAPGPGLIALIALATAIATQGTSSAWAASAIKAASASVTMSVGTAATVHAAVTAGFQALMVKATTSMAANNFDVGKVVKDLASSSTLKELAIKMISAGAMQYISGTLDIPTKASLQSQAAVSGKKLLDAASKINMGQRIINQALKAWVDSGLHAVVENKDFDEALGDAVKAAAIATATGHVTDKIDASFANDSMNTATHTASHVLTSVASGIASNNPNGVLVGAVEGLIAARLPEMFKGKDQKAEKSEKDEKVKEGFEGCVLGEEEGLQKQSGTKFKDNKAQLTTIQEQQLLEQILLQEDKERVKENIIRELWCHARQYASVGKDLDVQDVASRINNKIDTIESSTELEKFEKEFINMSLSSSSSDFVLPEVKLTAFQSPDNRENHPSQTSTARQSFKMRSALPNHSDNRFLDYLYTLGRGIERGRDEFVDTVLHPFDAVKNLAVSSFDGYNAITGLLFNYSTEGSRVRNAARGAAVLEGVERFQQADAAGKTEMISTVVTSGILGASAGLLASEGLHFSYTAAKTSYYTRNFTKALMHPSTEGHIFSKVKGKDKPIPGHVEDTLLNRRYMIKTFADKRNFLFENQHGTQTFARPLEKGVTESWVRVEKGKMKSAGVNGLDKEKPIEYFTNKDGSLSSQYAYVERTKGIQSIQETIREATVGAAIVIADNTATTPRNHP